VAAILALGSAATLLAPGSIPPVSADTPLPPYITVTKEVDDSVLGPGDPFTYTIQVACNEASCLDAELFDLLPPRLEGFPIQQVTATPTEAEVPRQILWTEGGAEIGQPTSVGAATALTVKFTANTTAPEGTGLQNGRTFTVQIRLQVPSDLPSGDPYDIVNAAEVTATNSSQDRDEATVTISVSTEIGVDVAKTWGPSPQTFEPGEPSSIGIEATNTSNTSLESLVVQEPATALDGASTLHTSNPFTITDFTGFGDVDLPTGATAVAVDAYVFDGATWSWVPGTAASSPALPGDVSADEVGGLRFRFTGAIAPGATAAVELDVEQRAARRDTNADLSTQANTVNNVARATATVAGLDPVSVTAMASYTVNPATLAVSAIKNITPDRISAGDTATALIGATNESDVGVNELRLSDLGYFTADITFGGFTSGLTWPIGTAEAKVVYHPLDGPDPQEVTFANGAMPASPSWPISGFEILFTATGGAIVPGATSNATFTIATSEAATATEGELTRTNTVDSNVTAPNGLGAVAEASDELRLVTPSLDVDLTKRILPNQAVRPGETVVTELSSNLTTSSDYVTATRIVVEDAWDGGTADFWNAFDLSSIAATQVPSNTSLTIDVQTAVGAWEPLQVFPPQAGPFIASMNTAAVDTALGLTPRATVTGVRFTFDNGGGFANDTTVVPYFVSTARSTLRTGGPTTPDPDVAVGYANTATTTGSGTTPVPTLLSATDQAVGTARIITGTGGGPGSVGIDKAWNQATVPTQSSARRTTTLTWGSGSGYESITISDPVDPTSPQHSVFQAFDLVAVAPIAFGSLNQAFTNGWFLRYDTITAVELYRGGAWVTVTPPGSGWVGASGFVGYTLTAGERADTTGIRLVLGENTAARLAAMSAGAGYDPFAPAPGAGVAASSGGRAFALTWEIRTTTRVGGDWVTAQGVYNVSGESNKGVVDNTVGISATPLGGGDPATDVGSDTIILLDPVPGVLVTKTVMPADPIFVPRVGTTDAAAYPTARFSIVANNNSVARASYVRVMDPARCTTAAQIAACQSAGTVAGALENPFASDVDWLDPGEVDSPFDRFDLVDVTIAASIPAEVDLAASTVWLLRYNAGAYTTGQVTAAAVNAMDAAALADVVGISVTFQGATPTASGGTITAANDLQITLDTRLRTTLRSTGAPQVLTAGQTVTVRNAAFAQSYDPILRNGALTGDRDDVAVTLTGGDINVGPAKSVTPSLITEPERDQTVTVRLAANQGLAPRSTLSPARVWLRDDIDSSPDFWNHFEFTGLGAITAPAGADRVAIDVFGPFGPGASDQWVTGTPTAIATAVLPIAAADHPLVEGVRFSFTRADGAFFSPAIPAPNWSAEVAFTVVLRDTFRASGEPIVLPAGSTTNVDNTVVVQSDRLTGEASPEREASATAALTTGSSELSVRKVANNGNRSASAGQVVPWDLTFENSGTGFLTITELRDTLPLSLVHLGDPAPTYSGEDDGLLSEDVTYVQDGQDLIFTWPTGGRRMAPGESFTIRIHLELQPIGAGQQALNTMTVHTGEVLDDCSHLGPVGTTTDAWDVDPTTCGTTDFVQPIAGPNLFTVKGVRGDLDGAFNPANPSQLCPASLRATGGDYHRAPCAANSRIGGIDDWVLRVQNAGTVDVRRITVFDQLPVDGDRLLVSGTSRGSVYRPRIVPGTFSVTAPTGTTVVVEVTTDPGVCQGTWSNLQNQEPCEQNGETWVFADESTDWALVTGVRVDLDFATSEDEALTTGQFVDVTFSTVNPPATASDPQGAPVAVPVVGAFAWNQFGVKYQNVGSPTFSKLAPSRVGVHLPSGPIRIDKLVTGGDAANAADRFLVDVTCEVEGAAVVMGDDAVVELDEGNDFSYRIDGIPFGASCVVAEQGDVGRFGETARDGTPAIVDIDVAAGIADGVAGAQVATITNVYEAAPPSNTTPPPSTTEPPPAAETPTTPPPPATTVPPPGTVPTGSPALTVDKTVSSDTVASGQSVTWTVVVTNTGNVPAVDVQVDDILPEGLVVQLPVAGMTYDEVGHRLTASIGELAAGASVTFSYVTIVNALPGAPLVNLVVVASQGIDGVTTVPGGTDSASVVPVAPGAGTLPATGTSSTFLPIALTALLLGLLLLAIGRAPRLGNERDARRTQVH
jgi:uncharacterized repeat protein (TIGR01451 family)